MWLLTVRYGDMRLIANFKTKLPDLKMGDKCVLKTDRGTEMGMVVSSPEKLTKDQDTERLGEVIRKATSEDFKQQEKIYREKMSQEMEFCQNKINELDLPIDLVFCEHILGGEKIVFYFLAEGRVDFRELVKELAKQYKTRIEMRQIGVRDEARLLADFEHCGRDLCCKTFIKELEPVTMKMAKSQKTTLDPAKISGRCGRLMCCLRFEDKIYTKLKGQLPKKGTILSTEKGNGEVINLDILSQQITLELENKEKIKISSRDIIKVIKEPSLKVEKTEDEE